MYNAKQHLLKRHNTALARILERLYAEPHLVRRVLVLWEECAHKLGDKEDPEHLVQAETNVDPFARMVHAAHTNNTILFLKQFRFWCKTQDGITRR